MPENREAVNIVDISMYQTVRKTYRISRDHERMLGALIEGGSIATRDIIDLGLTAIFTQADELPLVLSQVIKDHENHNATCDGDFFFRKTFVLTVKAAENIIYLSKEHRCKKDSIIELAIEYAEKLFEDRKRNASDIARNAHEVLLKISTLYDEISKDILQLYDLNPSSSLDSDYFLTGLYEMIAFTAEIIEATEEESEEEE